MSDNAPGPAELVWDAITSGRSFPDCVDDQLTYQRVIMNPGATWDYFAGHYDPEYARAHGQPTIFINTMHIAGFVDRAATAWAGPLSRVVRRSLTLSGSIYAGETMTGRTQIVAKRCSGGSDGTPRRWLTDLIVDVFNQNDVVCARSEVTLDVTRALRVADRAY